MVGTYRPGPQHQQTYDLNDRGTDIFYQDQFQPREQAMQQPPLREPYSEAQYLPDGYPESHTNAQSNLPVTVDGMPSHPQYQSGSVPLLQGHPTASYDTMSHNEPVDQVVEDFLLMDVVGGGSQSQAMSPFASKSVSAMHPTKPIIAYSAGCMVIVYDLMSDSKVNLVGHSHDVYSLAFTPNGDILMSVDFNRNAELQDNLNLQGGLNQEPTSQICIWDWQKGICIQDAPIPRSQNISMILAPTMQNTGLTLVDKAPEFQFQPNAASAFASELAELTGSAGQGTSCHIQIRVDKSGTLFMVLESSPLEIGGGYRVTLWSFNKHQMVEMISSMDLELQSPCIDLNFLPRSQSDLLNAQRSAAQSNHSAQVFLNSRLPFVTVEKNCIKLWEYAQGNAELKKKIHIKQTVAQLHISELTQFFLILGENGKVLILDHQGEFVSTLQQEGVVFTRIGLAHDKLLLGSNRGAVYVYHLASLQFISQIPYQLSFLEQFSLNSRTKQYEHEQLSLQKVGPPVGQIETTLNLRFLWIRYTDGSFAVVDRTIMNPRQAILGYSCGHFEQISGIEWIQPRSSMIQTGKGQNSYIGDSLALGGLFPQDISGLSNKNPHDQQFVTCSHDLSIHLWRHYGDRWAFSYIDVAKCFDQTLTFQRKQCDRSTRDLRLTALCLYPRSNHLVVGDSKGFVRVFQLVNESAHLLATYRLPRSKESQASRALGIHYNPNASALGAEDEFNNDLIQEIYVTSNEQTAVVTFSSGIVSLYDIRNSFNWIGDAADSDFAKFNTQTAGGSLSNVVQTKVLETAPQWAGNQTANQLRERNQVTSRLTQPVQDEHPYSVSGSYFTEGNATRPMSTTSQHFSSYSSNLKVFCLQTPNQVTMQLVDIKGTKVTRSALCSYVISDGKVTGFDLHPSKDYLIVTSSKGRIYVFRIDTGELRGTIKVPLNASGCHVDPSGLYVLIKVPAFANLNAMNLAPGAKPQSVGHFGANEKDLARNTVLLYEIGTGSPAAEICSIFEITQMKFSHDGRYLSLGSSNGAVSIWSLGSHIHQNIKQVLDAMQLSSDFWFNYPIFLPDYEQFNYPAAQELADDQYQTHRVFSDQRDLAAQPSNNLIRPPQSFSRPSQQQPLVLPPDVPPQATFSNAQHELAQPSTQFHQSQMQDQLNPMAGQHAPAEPLQPNFQADSTPNLAFQNQQSAS